MKIDRLLPRAIMMSLTVAAALTAAPGFAAAQTGGTICGTVWRDVNENGKHDADEPTIANTTIGLESVGSNYTNTDADGKYCLRNVPPGAQVLGANDRALMSPSEGWTISGQDSKFGFTTGRTQPITVADGQTIEGIDAGYRPARMDVRASQVIIEYGGKTYTSGKDWLTAPVQVGTEFLIVGGVVPDGNVAEQLGARLTVPAGLTILGQVGGMPATISGQTVSGMFHERRHPGAVEFLGVRVRADGEFSPQQIRLEALKGVYADTKPANNILTAKLSAKDGRDVNVAPQKDTMAAPKVVPAVVPPAEAAKPVAEAGSRAGTAMPEVTTTASELPETGTNPTPVIALSVGLLAVGGAGVWFSRRRFA
ncbi:SdrD B-like domain-containing protein [Actinokineospora sp. HUAS TT18]|uniref:SdrD B-like domain-containing protein n=1 Tax=Actinokineospora sp. HUAS TT18 TaxID=3447451 RepID=UPI003F524E8C